MAKQKRSGARISLDSRHNATGLMYRLDISRAVFYKRLGRMQAASRAGQDVPPLLPPVRVDRVSGGRWWLEQDVVEWETAGGHERARKGT